MNVYKAGNTDIVTNIVLIKNIYEDINSNMKHSDLFKEYPWHIVVFYWELGNLINLCIFIYISNIDILLILIRNFLINAPVVFQK